VKIGKWLCVVLLLGLRSELFAFQIVQLDIVGNNHIPTSRLLNAAITVETSLEKKYNTRSEVLLAVQKIQENIQRVYRQEGYYFSQIDSFQLTHWNLADSNRLTLSLFVTEGRTYTLDSILFEGNEQFTAAELQQQMETRSGALLDEQLLEEDIQEILQQYERAGYPLAQVVISRITPYNESDTKGKLSIQLTIREGKRARIGSITVVGNTVTNPEVITRELRIPVGAYYSAEEFYRARERVERLGYFESVEEPETYFIDDTTIALLVRVKEANTSTIDGIIGYNPPRNVTESGYINGYVDLSFRNISGTGRDGALRYLRETRESQELEVRYNEPWLFGYPLHLGLGFLQRQQDSSYVRTLLNGSLSFLLSENVSVIGSLELDRVVPTDLPERPFTVFDSRTVTTALTARYDSRDNLLAPHKGALLDIAASYGRKTLNGPLRFLDSTISSVEAVSSIAANTIFYAPIPTPKFVAVLGLHAGGVGGENIDASDLRRLGGIKTIRGYRESDFLVTRYLYGNLEYRVMTGRYSFLFAFTDAGYLFRGKTHTDETENIVRPWSYGIGVQMDSPLGLLSVSVATANGEPLDQAKLHFGIVKQF